MFISSKINYVAEDIKMFLHSKLKKKKDEKWEERRGYLCKK
jgi:hypothetical protein